MSFFKIVAAVWFAHISMALVGLGLWWYVFGDLVRQMF